MSEQEWRIVGELNPMFILYVWTIMSAWIGFLIGQRTMLSRMRKVAVRTVVHLDAEGFDAVGRAVELALRNEALELDRDRFRGLHVGGKPNTPRPGKK